MREFPGSVDGGVAVDQSSGDVYVVTNDRVPFGTITKATTMTIWISRDAGLTWTSAPIASYSVGYPIYGAPTIGVGPDGAVTVLFRDSERVRIVRSTDGGTTWTLGRAGAGSYYPRLVVGPTGEIAITGLSYDIVSHTWNPYVALYRPESNCLRVPGDPTSLCTGERTAYLPFFETASPYAGPDVAFGPDGAMHISYPGYDPSIYTRRQTAGPNLTGEPFC